MCIRDSLSTVYLAVLCCCGQALAQSNTSSDPTRPPPAFAAGAAGLTDAAVDSGGSRLRSVMLPRRGGKASAVIDGKVFHLGDTVGDSKLTRITETEVVLTGQNGKETLYLTPEVSKKMVVSKTARYRKKENP